MNEGGRGSSDAPRPLSVPGIDANHVPNHMLRQANILEAGPAASSNTNDRLRRLQALAWLLDNSIPLPGGFRIGVDALLGLIPGVGDAMGALISAYIVNEARNMGASRSVLLRMMGNVLIETAIGSIPFAGDVFDAAFKANARNLALLQAHHFDPAKSRRNSRFVVAGFSVLIALFALFVVAVPVLLVVALVKAF